MNKADKRNLKSVLSTIDLTDLEASTATVTTALERAARRKAALHYRIADLSEEVFRLQQQNYSLEEWTTTLTTFLHQLQRVSLASQASQASRRKASPSAKSPSAKEKGGPR